MNSVKNTNTTSSVRPKEEKENSPKANKSTQDITTEELANLFKNNLQIKLPKKDSGKISKKRQVKTIKVKKQPTTPPPRQKTEAEIKALLDQKAIDHRHRTGNRDNRSVNRSLF